ncbi:hypothetical protein MRX96_018481 [Rhipicephalus microplus]
MASCQSSHLTGSTLVPSRDINFCMGPHCACPQLNTYERLFTRKTKVMLKNHLAVVQLLNTLGKVLSPGGGTTRSLLRRGQSWTD